MRVTTEMQGNSSILNVQLAYAKLSKLQSQISSGNQVQVPSDDPVGVVQILQNNAALSQLTTNLSTIQSAASTLQNSVTTLTSAQTLLTSVKGLALTANNPTNQAGSNTALAAQVNADINQLLGIANTQLPDGSYLFSGTASHTQPYSITGSNPNGQTTGIAYQGSDQAAQVLVGTSTSVSTLIPGSSIFQTINSGTNYVGTTGAQASSIPDSATGTGTLQVQHTLTTFAGTSGVDAGLSSGSLDTILGPSGKNTLTITDSSGTGTSGTISLNGGPPITFSNTNQNLKVTGPSGEVVYLDTTSITPGFTGNVDITSTGTLSVDGGASTIPIDFSTSQQVIDSATGAVTNVNSSNIRKTGTEQLDYTGKADIFQTLIALRDTIANTQGLSSADRSAALTKQIGILDKFNTALAKPIGDQSTQAQFLSNLKSHAADQQTNLKESTSNIQSTDMASAIVEMQQQQIQYQVGLQLTASLNQMSLANFIK